MLKNTIILTIYGISGTVLAHFFIFPKAIKQFHKFTGNKRESFRFGQIEITS